MENVNILFVDDERSLIQAFERLAQKGGQSFAVARTGVEAIEHLCRNGADVVLADLDLAGFSGLQILEYIKKNDMETEVILMTGEANVDAAVSALKKGAYDYLIKPFDDLERVSFVIRKAVEKAQLLRRIRNLEFKGLEGDRYLDMIGKSEGMREVFGLIERVGPTHSSVLILGESGTGKELAARALHEKSRRREKTFVVINCSALPETLLESELFGYEKGAFTGAHADKKGLLEVADQGTIFLDEIGEIPPSVQVKLLRVLQNGEIRRIGGSENIRTDVRVISATNADLHDLVKKKAFREDLFYRLNVITITMPPLRERREDIPSLSYHFMRKYADSSRRKVDQISIDALQTLQEYRWPGNVRELENAIERAVILAEGNLLTARDLPSKLLGEFFYLPEAREEKDFFELPYREAKEKALNLFNRTYISNMLRQTEGNISLASERAGMDRSNFKKIVRKSEISLREFSKKKVSA